MFTEEQLGRFQRDGFFAYPAFFDRDEVAVLQDEIERFKSEGLLRNVATDGDGRTHSTQKKNLQLCPTYPHSPRFKALPFDDKVVRAISTLIGDPCRVRLDQVFLKPAKDGAGTSWHQDNAYFRVSDPMKGVAMWIAVHDATVANGTMHFIPGLQHERLEHSRDPLSDHHIRCYPDESRQTPCELEAGGVLFFAYGTPHCTKGNSTDRDRAGLAYHFFHADYPPQDGFADIDMPYLTGPKAQGGLEEYGEDQRGKWRGFVEEMRSSNRVQVA
jgi:ectoine hydroxylase-related dioxygenase (phytanoyl-CoA dioxygenase family)